MIDDLRSSQVGKVAYHLFILLAFSYLLSATFLPTLEGLIQIQLWSLLLTVLLHGLFELRF